MRVEFAEKFPILVDNHHFDTPLELCCCSLSSKAKRRRQLGGSVLPPLKKRRKDCRDTIYPVMEGEEDLIAAAQQIMKALVTKKKDLSDDARKVLATVHSELSNISMDESREDQVVNEIELQLNCIQDKILGWEKDQVMIWDFGSEKLDEYLKTVGETRQLIEILENKSSTSNSNEVGNLLCKACDVLHTVMFRLKEEFRYLLLQCKHPFELEIMSCLPNSESYSAISVISSGNSFELSQRASTVSLENVIVDLDHLVFPDVIPDLKTIATSMFDSGYGHECCQVFTDVQNDALDDCLFILKVEKMSVEDILKMEWDALNSKIGRWIKAMKIFVRVYLASEKLLCDQIFGELKSISYYCFAESSRTSLLQLLDFGEAITITDLLPQKLIRILDMYEVLADLIPDIIALYEDGMGSSIIGECEHILKRLGECAKAAFLELEDAVVTNVSSSAFPGGGVHPLTRDVMNCTKDLRDYRRILHEVLKDQDKEDSNTVSPNASPGREEEDAQAESCKSAMAIRFCSLISLLEANLEEKANLYREEALQHLFLMNNFHYMAKKVKGSEIRYVLGDDWIRKRNWKFQQYAMSYERSTWSSILSLLKDEGLQNPSSNSVSRTILKERLQSFYLAFEEVYKSQTGWTVPNFQLRAELRILISLKVIEAYRTFVRRHGNHINKKHIKYTADDLEVHLLDFFEASQKSLHGGHRK